MMLPSWLRGPRGEPARVGASRSFCRISGSTRRNEVRVPAYRNRAQTFRCPSPWNGLAASTPWIALVSASSDIAPSGPHRCAAGAADRRRYTPERASRHTRQTASKPYGLPVTGERARLIACACVGQKGRALQDGDLLVQQVTLYQRRP